MKLPSWLRAAIIAFVAVVIVGIVSLALVWNGKTLAPLIPTLFLLFPMWMTALSLGISSEASVSEQIIMSVVALVFTGFGYAILAALWESWRKRLSARGKKILIVCTIVLLIVAVLAPWPYIVWFAR